MQYFKYILYAVVSCGIAQPARAGIYDIFAHAGSYLAGAAQSVIKQMPTTKETVYAAAGLAVGAGAYALWQHCTSKKLYSYAITFKVDISKPVVITEENGVLYCAMADNQNARVAWIPEIIYQIESTTRHDKRTQLLMVLIDVYKKLSESITDRAVSAFDEECQYEQHIIEQLQYTKSLLKPNRRAYIMHILCPMDKPTDLDAKLLESMTTTYNGLLKCCNTFMTEIKMGKRIVKRQIRVPSNISMLQCVNNYFDLAKKWNTIKMGWVVARTLFQINHDYFIAAMNASQKKQNNEQSTDSLLINKSKKLNDWRIPPKPHLSQPQ